MNTKKLTAEEAQEAVAHDPENLVAKDKDGNVWAWNPDFNVIGFPGYGRDELGAERLEPFTIHRIVLVGEEHAEVLKVLDDIAKVLRGQIRHTGTKEYAITRLYNKIAEIRQRYEGGKG